MGKRTKNIKVRVPQELYQYLEDMKNYTGVSKSDLIRDALMEDIKRAILFSEKPEDEKEKKLKYIEEYYK